MYINFINDRQKLEYDCIENICTVKQLEKNLKNHVTWVLKKSKHLFIFLFSEKVLVGVFIFLRSRYIINSLSFTSFEVFQFYLIKSVNVRVLNSLISNSILKSKKG